MEVTNSEAPITLTEAAARAIRTKAERAGFPEGPLRVKVQGGGCSGATYVMSFEDAAPREGDFVTTQHGATVVVDPVEVTVDLKEKRHNVELHIDIRWPKPAAR